MSLSIQTSLSGLTLSVDKAVIVDVQLGDVSIRERDTRAEIFRVIIQVGKRIGLICNSAVYIYAVSLSNTYK